MTIDMYQRAARGSRPNLTLGFWSAWATVVLAVLYAAAVIAAGAFSGVPHDPFWAVAETLAIITAVCLVVIMAAIQACAVPQANALGSMALGWMMAVAGLTITVHFVELTVARRIDLASSSALRWIFGFEWPSLLYGVEIVALPSRYCRRRSPSEATGARGGCEQGSSALECCAC
jgi:hypothetical protein